MSVSAFEEFGFRFLADFIGAGSRLAPGVGHAHGIPRELGQALAPEGAVLIRAVGVLNALHTFAIDSA